MPPAAIRKITETLWELPVTHREGMRVPARIYATEALLGGMDQGVFDQLANVACLPGIVGNALCMPDGHWGYGFPIGGTAAFDPEKGIISPGGIGFDINCGMRLIGTGLTEEEVAPRIRELVDALFAGVPSGVGSAGLVKLGSDEFCELLRDGSAWALRRGYADSDDLERTEDRGCAAGADPEAASLRAMERGIGQVGTLGSGNHYLEIQVARDAEILDRGAAAVMGITKPGQILVMIHCGSRGFGHQVASDYLKRFLPLMTTRWKLPVRDRELACAPFDSDEGREYFAAMNCAVNMAFVNRQVIAHRVREIFSDVFKKSPADLGMRQIYDVTHNTAKLERHRFEGVERELLVHRKGATRALGPETPGIPADFREIGQPVIIGGSMETGSYLLLGTGSGGEAFHTTAHGSGRTMGRGQAKKQFRGTEIRKRMAERGIYVRSVSDSGLAEEAGGAYKDIDEVVSAAEAASLSRRVVRLVPIGNIKG